MTELVKIASVIGRRWLVVVIVWLIGILLLPTIIASSPPFTAQAQLLIVSEAQKDTTVADPSLPSIVTSTEVLNRVIQRLRLNTDSQTLAKRIKTKLPDKSSILGVSYKDTNRIRAANVVNAVADESATYYHEIAVRGYAEVLHSLQVKVSESRAKIVAAERLLQKVSAEDAFASSDKAPDNLISQILAIQTQRGQMSASLAADQVTKSVIQRQLHAVNPVVRAEIIQKDLVSQELETELGKDVADLVSERSSFQDAFPGLKALVRRVDRERRQVLAAEARAVKAGLGSSPSFAQAYLEGEHAVGSIAADSERLRVTDKELADAEEQLREVVGAGATVSTLRADRDAAVSAYLVLTQRLASAQGDAAQAASLGTLIVVSRAVPARSGSETWLFELGFLVVVIAIAAAYLVDLLDRRLWGAREIEEVYGRPLLTKVGVYR